MQVNNKKSRGSGRAVVAVIIFGLGLVGVSPCYGVKPQPKKVTESTISHRGEGRIEDVGRYQTKTPANLNSGGCPIPAGQPLVCPPTKK